MGQNQSVTFSKEFWGDEKYIVINTEIDNVRINAEKFSRGIEKIYNESISSITITRDTPIKSKPLKQQIDL